MGDRGRHVGNSWKKNWQRVRTVPGLGRNSLAVVVAIALGVTTVAIVFSNVKFIGFWEDRYVFSADFDQAPAVIPDQNPKVRVAGVDVGKVTESTITKEGNARLTFSLEPDVVIYRNARVLLRPKNPVNEMYVEIAPGGPPAERVAQNEVLPTSQTERPIQPDEVLQNLDERTRSALSNLLAVSDVALVNAPETLPDGLDATNRTLRTFQPVLEKLHERRENISALVSSLSQVAAAAGGNRQRVAQLADSMQQSLRVLEERDDELASVLEQLPGTTGHLQDAMDSVGRLSSELDPVLENVKVAAGELPAVLRRTSATVDSLERTVDAARPVISAAGPLVNDLRPLVADVDSALDSLQPLSRTLEPATATLVPYLNDVAAFIYNTSGVFAPADANGGFVRGHLTVPLPDGGVLPGTHGGNGDLTAPQGEN